MLVNMAERGGGVTDMACGLLIRRSSCCHCSKKKKCNKVSRGKTERGEVTLGEGLAGGLGGLGEEVKSPVAAGQGGRGRATETQ